MLSFKFLCNILTV